MEHQSFQTSTNLDNYRRRLVIANLGNWTVDHVELDLVLEAGLGLGRDLIVNQDQEIEQVEQALGSL